MSGPEVTAAVQRAADAGVSAWTEAMTEAYVPHVWRHVAQATLAAALDVEEMARAAALATGMPPDSEPSLHGVDCSATGGCYYHAMARAVVAHLIGGAA